MSPVKSTIVIPARPWATSAAQNAPISIARSRCAGACWSSPSRSHWTRESTSSRPAREQRPGRGTAVPARSLRALLTGTVRHSAGEVAGHMPARRVDEHRIVQPGAGRVQRHAVRYAQNSVVVPTASQPRSRPYFGPYSVAP